MHKLYSFDFLETVSSQLRDALNALPITQLNEAALADLNQAQVREKAAQGVYFLYLDGKPFYLGKADDVADRLTQHLEKLRGRTGIDVEKAGYKAILLDRSMSTAANEKLLIGMFTASHKAMWNGKGFGPKDPGQERDTTKPSKFDQEHPIIANYPIVGLGDTEAIGDLFQKMKQQLPYLFRSVLDADNAGRTVNINGAKDACALLEIAIASMAPGWQGAILSYGMVVYKTDKHYKYAAEVFKSPGAAQALGQT